MARTVLLILLCLFSNLSLPSEGEAQQARAIPELSTAQWRQDLRLFAEGVTKHHKNAFHLVSKERFDSAFAALDRRIPSLKGYEVVVGLQSLAAMIGDGHTFLATWGIQRYYPLDFFWFGRDLRVVRAAPAYKDALGGRVIKIGNANVGDVAATIQSVIPQGENEWYVLNQSAQQMVRADLLAALGVGADAARAAFVLEDETGKQSTVMVTSVAPDAKVDWIGAPKDPPLYLQRPEEQFWFTYLPKSHTVYVSFRGYGDIEQKSRRLFTFLDHHPVERLVIDMRNNGGGNYTLGRQQLIYPIQMRPALNRAGHLLVITGRATFSAGMTNAIDFHRETDALLVSEPIGARPRAYQENYWLTLPNSHLRVSVASLVYKFQDGDSPAFMPDQVVAPDWADHEAGRDPVVGWISAYKNSN
jgi:hypothetical protein